MIIPTSAVKTASAITRGFINATKSGRRVSQRERAGNGRRRIEIAVVFMVSSLNANDLAFGEVNNLLHGVRRDSPKKPRRLNRRRLGRAQFDDLECGDPLHAGRARLPYGFQRLHLSLSGPGLAAALPRAVRFAPAAGSERRSETIRAASQNDRRRLAPSLRGPFAGAVSGRGSPHAASSPAPQTAVGAAALTSRKHRYSNCTATSHPTIYSVARIICQHLASENAYAGTDRHRTVAARRLDYEAPGTV